MQVSDRPRLRACLSRKRGSPNILLENTMRNHPGHGSPSSDSDDESSTREAGATSKDGITTGLLALDRALGTGGWPRGRIVEVFGSEGSGKTTLLLEAIAHAQQNGGFGAFLDADHGVEPATAERLGVQWEAMPYHRPASLEEAFERIEELVRGGAVNVIALDSLAALLPMECLSCSRDAIPPYKNEQHQHRISHCLKALLGPLSRSKAVLLISNPLVEKTGVFFGNPQTTPWETQPLKIYASQIVEVRRAATIKEGEDSLGLEIKARVVKNRLAAPMTQTEFELYFATGFSVESELLTLGLELGIVSKRGNRLSFGDVLLGGGRSEALRNLQRDGDLAARLRESLLERLSS
jgi:recombination protein RecA